jgi:hypothetical protein
MSLLKIAQGINAIQTTRPAQNMTTWDVLAVPPSAATGLATHRIYTPPSPRECCSHELGPRHNTLRLGVLRRNSRWRKDDLSLNGLEREEFDGFMPPPSISTTLQRHQFADYDANRAVERVLPNSQGPRLH